MNATIKLIIAGGAISAIGIAGAGAAVASGGGEGTEPADTPITGPALDQASAAALAHLGEGRVTETEVGDEESLYEVEVTLDNGTEVDVQLDENFTVVGTEADGPGDTDKD